MVLRLTEEQVIKKANQIHSNKYNYDNLQYKSFHEPININCSLHGNFKQSLANHLAGKGCPSCKFEKLSNLYKSSKEEFIKKANKIHKNLYDYSDVVYKGNKQKVKIKCHKHGYFYQNPNKHLSGRGCQICKASKGEQAIKAILDKYKIPYIQEHMLPEIVSLLKYDFYLPDYNLLIEFHGRQHFEYIPFLHGYDELNFLSQKERDIIKKDYAYRFKYRFLEFNYKQLKHMTEVEFEEMIVRSLQNLEIKC